MSSFLPPVSGAIGRFASRDSRVPMPGRRPLFTAVSILHFGLLISPVQGIAAENNSDGCQSPAAPSSGGASIQHGATKSHAILGKRMSALEAMQINQNKDLPDFNRQTSAENCIGDRETIFEQAIPIEPAVSSIIVNQKLIARALSGLRTKATLGQTAPINAKPRLASVGQWTVFKHPAFASKSVVTQLAHRAPVRQRRIETKVGYRYSGKPDIFGTIALPVSRTPLDGKWNAARHRGDIRGAKYALTAAGGKGGAGNRETNIRAVNRWVNNKVRYVEDRTLYGIADHWANVGKTLKLGRGDCEDFAIAKMQILRASGIKSSDMFLVIAKDLVRRADHALLVVRFEDRLLVLDNETDKILDARDVRDYRPIMSYSANQKWLHGYPAKPATRQMASLTIGR